MDRDRRVLSPKAGEILSVFVERVTAKKETVKQRLAARHCIANVYGPRMDAHGRADIRSSMIADWRRTVLG